jgi:alkaline phosphatase
VQARQNGKATGLVTTTRLTHATPASFVVNIPHRDMEDAIAEQMLERGVEVMLGGGAKHFKPALRKKFPGVRFLNTAAELRAEIGAGGSATGGASSASSTPLMGLFADDHLPMRLDRTERSPTLEDMTRAALSRLDRSPNGFVLQVEGGRVDHAAHDNDAAGLVADQLEFDRTLGVVLEWIEDRDDTLLIVTTDHGNANPGLTLYGKRGEEGLKRLLAAKHSFPWIESEFAKREGVDAQAADAGRIVEEATGVALDGEGVRILGEIIRGRRVMPFRDANLPVCVLGSLLATHFGVSFISPNHTSDFVELTAMGPGSESIRPVVRNHEIWNVVAGALGLEPGTPLEGMEKVLTKLPVGQGD